VGPLTKKEPQTHSLSLAPNIGTTPARFTITVAAQKPMFPIGRVYPKKAVAIRRRRSTTPMFHVSTRWFLPMYSPRDI
jgi:hypothetical protein